MGWRQNLENSSHQYLFLSSIGAGVGGRPPPQPNPTLKIPLKTVTLLKTASKRPKTKIKSRRLHRKLSPSPENPSQGSVFPRSRKNSPRNKKQQKQFKSAKSACGSWVENCARDGKFAPYPSNNSTVKLSCRCTTSKRSKMGKLRNYPKTFTLEVLSAGSATPWD